MKRTLACILGLGLSVAMVAAEGRMLLGPKSLDASAGVGIGYSRDGNALDLVGGAEYIIGKFTVGEVVPLSYGAAARVGLGVAGGKSYLGLGALGTLHISWGGLALPKNLEWMDKIDSYFGLGIQFLPYGSLNSIVGSNYFLTDKLAFNFESGLAATRIGLLWKF